MVDQELLVQKALEKKLDGDPRVMQGIEGSKRQILSQAYVDQLTHQLQKPSADEIKKFYDARPELFARGHDLSPGGTRDPQPAGDHPAIARGGDPQGEVAQRRRRLAGSEERPLQRQLHGEDGRATPARSAAQAGPASGSGDADGREQGYLLVQVAATETQPLDEKQATPFIEQFLVNQKKLDLARNEVKQLREAATIEYVGSLAEGAAAKAAEAPKPEAPKAAEKSAIDKGGAGLR